jgi:tagaturonate reductase
MAALIAVYKDGHVEGSAMKAMREKGEFTMKDDLPALEFFENVWESFDGSKESAAKVAERVLANTAIWGEDLNNVEGLAEKVGDYLYQITKDGIKATVKKLI